MWGSKIDTSGSSLTAAQLPLPSGSAAPSVAEQTPAAAGVKQLAHVIGFGEAAAQALHPAGYAKTLTNGARVGAEAHRPRFLREPEGPPSDQGRDRRKRAGGRPGHADAAPRLRRRACEPIADTPGPIAFGVAFRTIVAFGLTQRHRAKSLDPMIQGLLSMFGDITGYAANNASSLYGNLALALR